jgi:hypothetical protein
MTAKKPGTVPVMVLALTRWVALLTVRPFPILNVQTFQIRST